MNNQWSIIERDVELEYEATILVLSQERRTCLEKSNSQDARSDNNRYEREEISILL